VLFVAALQGLLSLLSEQHGWKLWFLPWWSWLILIVPELLLTAWLVGGRRPHQIYLIIAMSVGNVVLLTALIGSVVLGREHDGGELLLKGVAVWATNVAAFGLAFWELEKRTDDDKFQFPQTETDSEWQPHFFDYFYVAFTNSIAFSPTDAMPLTRFTKLLMLAESAVSAIAILLVAARAVNIFK
jgi:uncharacterized membrane protein